MEHITSIFDRHNTDKGSSWHNFGRQYDALFAPYRSQQSLAYLEIGVLNGGSLRAMREVFPHARCIVGVDINPDAKQHEDVDKHIFVEIGNATDPSFVQMIHEKYGPFDVILDDGSHYNRDVIQSFELLFPLLLNHGLYVVEDTNVDSLPSLIIEGYPSHLTYFFSVAKLLNRSYTNTYCADPFKSDLKTTDPIEQGVDRVEIGCAFIAIHKLVRTHWIP